jgi:hypothetical protein
MPGDVMSSVLTGRISPQRGWNKPARGNAPGKGSPPAASPERAVQTKAPARFVSPFQGTVRGGGRFPGAMPRAGMWLPLRGEEKPHPTPYLTFAFPIAWS